MDGTCKILLASEVCKIQRYARKITALLDSEGATDIDISGYAPMTGGYSSLWPVLMPNSTIDGEQEEGTFVLRGDPPEGQAIIETDRSQEYAVLKSVAPHLNTPPARFLDAEGIHIGTPALILEFTEAESTLPWIEKNGIRSSKNSLNSPVLCTPFL